MSLCVTERECVCLCVYMCAQLCMQVCVCVKMFWPRKCHWIKIFCHKCHCFESSFYFLPICLFFCGCAGVCIFLKVLPWGSVFFTLCIQPPSEVISQSRCGHHKSADDTQLHQSSTPSDFCSLNVDTEQCIDSFGRQMTGNRLKLNNDQTEALLVGPRRKVSMSTISWIQQPLLSWCVLFFSVSWTTKVL